jgi:polyribonucleotide nucleotidyltransferase
MLTYNECREIIQKYVGQETSEQFVDSFERFPDEQLGNKILKKLEETKKSPYSNDKKEERDKQLNEVIEAINYHIENDNKKKKTSWSI